jgi:hypothetical protein
MTIHGWRLYSPVAENPEELQNPTSPEIGGWEDFPVYRRICMNLFDRTGALG